MHKEFMLERDPKSGEIVAPPHKSDLIAKMIDRERNQGKLEYPMQAVTTLRMHSRAANCNVWSRMTSIRTHGVEVPVWE